MEVGGSFSTNYRLNTTNYIKQKKSSSFQNCFNPLGYGTGWMMGLEPTTPGTTNQCSNQLSYNHRVFVSAKVRISTHPANFFVLY